MLPILWAICATVTQGPAPATDIRTAPPLPSWPTGLGVPLRVPAEARCEDVEGVSLPPGAYVPEDRSVAVVQRLVMLAVSRNRWHLSSKVSVPFAATYR